MNKTEKLIRRKMLERDIESLKEVSERMGIKYLTFLERMKNPSMFRAFEIVSLQDVLDLEDMELLTILKGE